MYITFLNKDMFYIIIQKDLKGVSSNNGKEHKSNFSFKPNNNDVKYTKYVNNRDKKYK
jgi:hypothetical protein